MAAYTGSHVHRLMQWKKLSAPTMLGCDVIVPDEDNFPDAVTAPLEELLLLHTKCHECWIGVWRGWGGHEGYYYNHVPYPTKYVEDSHGRDIWDLFRAPLNVAFAPVAWAHTANLVWAADRSWWATKGINLHTTYIGGSASLIDAVLETDALEALPAELEDDVTINSDRLNVGAAQERSTAQQPWRVVRTLLRWCRPSIVNERQPRVRQTRVAQAKTLMSAQESTPGKTSTRTTRCED